MSAANRSGQGRTGHGPAGARPDAASRTGGDLSGYSMLELFQTEAVSQSQALIQGLLALERNSRATDALEGAMRAAHSLKGAARIVGLMPAVQLMHAAEDCLVAARDGRLALDRDAIDALLWAVDLLLAVADSPAERALDVDGCLRQLQALGQATEPQANQANQANQTVGADGLAEAPATAGPGTEAARKEAGHADARGAASAGGEPAEAGRADRRGAFAEGGPATAVSGLEPAAPQAAGAAGATGAADAVDEPPSAASAPDAGARQETMLRMSAQSMTRLMGLAGESLIEARRLRPFANRLQGLKRRHGELAQALEALSGSLRGVPAAAPATPPALTSGSRPSPMAESVLESGEPDSATAQAARAVQIAQAALDECRAYLAARLDELDLIDRQGSDLAHRLYSETQDSRMIPFGDGVRHQTRVVRDLGRALGKDIRLSIVGESTGIDRDILDQLDVALLHLLRNAIDHGVETAAERLASGKPAESLIRLEARHNAGRLQIVVADDGRGVDLTRLARAVGERRLIGAEAIARLSEAELLEFLFLPGFSLKPEVNEISGRGVGLDAVQSLIKQVRGSITVSTAAGEGTTFLLELPLTLSVLRTLLVDVAGHPYALPLAGVARALKLPRQAILDIQGRPHFILDGDPVRLVTAHQLLGSAQPPADGGEIAVVVIGDGPVRQGIVVDRLLGGHELVIRPLDERLGKVQDISAAAVLDDGSPVLVMDVDDLLRSAGKLVASAGEGAAARGLRRAQAGPAAERPKRVLVVDDSLTVRELERKLLDERGYDVEVAVDGMDGWNAIRSGNYDLLITDVDMPRMDGIELVGLVKGDARLKSLPVMIVSYKDREEDRRRGLDAGADYYLAKGSFHDETLAQAVLDLIGPAGNAAPP